MVRCTKTTTRSEDYRPPSWWSLPQSYWFTIVNPYHHFVSFCCLGIRRSNLTQFTKYNRGPYVWWKTAFPIKQTIKSSCLSMPTITFSPTIAFIFLETYFKNACIRYTETQRLPDKELTRRLWCSLRLHTSMWAGLCTWSSIIRYVPTNNCLRYESPFLDANSSVCTSTSNKDEICTMKPLFISCLICKSSGQQTGDWYFKKYCMKIFFSIKNSLNWR